MYSILFWYKIFVYWKLKLLDFLLDFVFHLSQKFRQLNSKSLHNYQANASDVKSVSLNLLTKKWTRLLKQKKRLLYKHIENSNCLFLNSQRQFFASSDWSLDSRMWRSWSVSIQGSILSVTFISRLRAWTTCLKVNAHRLQTRKDRSN